MKTINSEQGAFGDIKVIDTPQARRMIINNTVQGAFFHAPCASELYSDVSRGPGPVIEAPYQLAWLMAGLRYQSSKALMLGMGCGSGAVCLLYHFPGIALDVVEIDPVVVRSAIRHFPLVRYYQEQKRLRIVTADAFDYVFNLERSYAFVLIDLVIDQYKTNWDGALDSFITPILTATSEIWLNTIDSIDSESFFRRISSFEKVGLPATYILSPVSPKAWLPIRRNWIITTAPAMPTTDGFIPYTSLNTPGVQLAREHWQIVTTSHIAVDCYHAKQSRLLPSSNPDQP